MKSASYALINCVLILLPGAASFAGQTQLDSGESGRGGPIAKEVSQWVMHYYQKPQPEAFETRVRQMAQCNLLRSQEPVFLGRVLAQNPGRIAAWLDALQDLEEADRAVLSKAAWLSDAREARQWLEKMQIQEYAGKRPPDLFAGPRIITAGTLDEYWAWFFATGDIKPVRAIVGSFYGGGDPVSRGRSRTRRPSVATPAGHERRGAVQRENGQLSALRRGRVVLLEPGQGAPRAGAASQDD